MRYKLWLVFSEYHSSIEYVGTAGWKYYKIGYTAVGTYWQQILRITYNNQTAEYPMSTGRYLPMLSP